MGEFIRLLRLALATPFLVGGLLLGAYGVYGLYKGESVAPYLILAFLCAPIAALLLPKKGRKRASPFAREYRHKGGGWRNDPATERQKTFARDLGIKFPANISKGELSDRITDKTGSFSG
jgi:hypothetical protein